jgi:hypothetical protein
VTKVFPARLRLLLGCVFVFPLGVLGVSPSRAADTCTGYDTLVVQSIEVTDLGKGLKQTTSRSQSVVLSNDSIYQALAGECSNVMLQTEDGKTQLMGYCARRDKDGDTQSIAFHLAAGADKGQWQTTGGTGKYAGKQDKGWFQPMLADGKMSVTRWGGDCH